MKFSEIVKQAVSLLQESQRITYRALKRKFGLDDDALEDLKRELIDAQRVAIDEDGKVLVWVGEGKVVSSQSSVLSFQPLTPHPQPPISYTLSHLAEKLLINSLKPVHTSETVLRQAQHEREKGPDAEVSSVHPEPVEGRTEGFSTASQYVGENVVD